MCETWKDTAELSSGYGVGSPVVFVDWPVVACPVVDWPFVDCFVVEVENFWVVRGKWVGGEKVEAWVVVLGAVQYHTPYVKSP